MSQNQEEKQGASNIFDDDGRVKRTGNIWTASAHIITAAIGSEVLGLSWTIAQLGWIFGPIVIVIFSILTYYTSNLLASCYRSGDSVTGTRNYTYIDAVRSNLGGFQVKVCGAIQYLNLFGVAIGYTIASSISMMSVKRSNCFHSSGGKNPCKMSSNPYMIAFGIIEILFSQIPDFDQIRWLSIIAAVMSLTYSTIGLSLEIAKVVETRQIRGSLFGISIGVVSKSEKIWRSFQALGGIAQAYSYSLILIEIQDTLKSPPSEHKTMRKATLLSVVVTTFFYMLCGCFGFAAFGDFVPKNLLSGFGFHEPFWLLNIANIAILIHLVGTYQVFCQPLFAFVEKTVAEWYPGNKFITKDITIPIPGFKSLKVNLFRLVWRTIFVIVTTVISIILPFFNSIAGLFGALAFWPLAAYFPVEMYIAQKKITKWSTRWVCLQILSAACLVITIAAAVGSIVEIIADLKVYKPFDNTY